MSPGGTGPTQWIHTPGQSAQGQCMLSFTVAWAVAYVTPKKAECGVCFFVTFGICECHLTSSGMVRPSMGCCLRIPGWQFSNCRRS